MAGIIALLASKHGKFGFINPLFYQLHDKNKDAFRDITIGNNGCTSSSGN